MNRRILRAAALPAMAIFALSLVISGCGGGGGGGGSGTPSGNGALVGVSFIGFTTAPAPAGPNAGIPLPTVFIDEVLQFTFDGPIDDGIFGGFYSVGGTPQEFIGVSGSPTAGTPYYAYNDQSIARTSFEVNVNVAPGGTNAGQLQSYIVGRHRDLPNVLVIDPKVANNNPFGLPFNAGFIANTVYTYRIPSTTSLRISGRPAQALGVSPLTYPILLPNFNPQPNLSILFLSGNATGPDPVPPAVVSINAASTTGSTILATDPIIVTFSKPIDPSSLNPLANFTVRNASQGNAIVPGTLVVNQATPNVATFTPTPSFGPGLGGPPPTTGYNITVRVGSFGSATIPPILGVPQGTQAAQLPLSNSLQRTFVTTPCPTCLGAATVVETWDTNAQRDATFVPQFNQLAWNTASASPSLSLPGKLGSIAISGTPYATFSGGVLGTRVQRTMVQNNVSFPGTIPGPGPAGLYSPFDDNTTNNLGANVNPNGGSHIMHLYEPVDLGSIKDSLELIEWGPLSNFVQQTTYPNYYAWCGLTSSTAPYAGGGGIPGLSAVYAVNYNLASPQPADPLNPSNPPSGCPYPSTIPPIGGVRVTGPIGYGAGPGFTSYYPFPLFTPPYDYLATGTGFGSLVFEQNISPGTQLANFNRYRSSAISPVRRIIGAPRTLTTTCNSGTPIAAGGGLDVYDMRFTFVGIVSTGRSNFYDTAVTTAQGAQYVNFTLSPSPQNQPANTSAVWELEGANNISSPSTATGGTTGFLTYWSGTPAAGTFNPLALSAPSPAISLSGRRYFRFRATLKNDNVNNGRQQYESFIMAFTF